MIYYVDNSERSDVNSPSAKKNYEAMGKSLEAVFGVEVHVQHYSQVSIDEVKALNPQAAVLSGCGTPWEQFIKCDFSKEFELIRSGLLPILGICGGHQIIGMAYGAEIAPMRRLKPGEKDTHVGTPSEGYFYEMEYLPVKIINADALFEGMGDVITVHEGHYCEIKNLPSDFELLASTEECRIQAMRHKQPPAPFGKGENLTY
ncbi:MAG: gamma-glutamyl-gamma-aminobutyrate hydrolase family protein, partial [Bacteroidia bacterium]|nr:gamma-glutamyl-gamma-aminobutyrate hydrolase family protein [Bacteroidia bacterium]